MKTGLNDKVLEKIIDLQNKVSNKIVEKTKGDKPFASVKMPDDEIIWAIRNTSEQDRMALIQEFGTEAVNKLLYKAVMAGGKHG